MTFSGKVDTKYPTAASTCIIIIHSRVIPAEEVSCASKSDRDRASAKPGIGTTFGGCIDGHIMHESRFFSLDFPGIRSL